MGQEVITFIFAWIFSTVLIDESKTSTTGKPPQGETLLSRSKRNLADFSYAIGCYNKDINHFMDIWKMYGDYGCFCGRGGEGTPLDETDKCCKMHDRCWGEVNKLKPWWIFFQNWYNMYYPGGYESECKNGNVLCQSEKKHVKALCDCDREAAICFAKNYHTYKPQFRLIDTQTYCHDEVNRKMLNYTVPSEIKNKRIFINSDGVLIHNLNESEAEYPKTTELPTMKNISTTSKAQDSIEEIPMTTANKVSITTSNATSVVSETKAVSSKTNEATKGTNIDEDLDIQRNIKRNTSIASTTTNKDEKTTQVLDDKILQDLDTDRSSVKYDLYRVIYSEEFTFLMILLLVVSLCLCYYFLWRYTKLPLLPLKSKSDCSFTKAIFREKSGTEKFCLGSNV